MGHPTLAREIAASRGMLMRAARVKVANRAWIEDAVAETLLAALEGTPPSAEPHRLRGWLLRILDHKLVDQMRRHGGQRPVVAESDLPNGRLDELLAEAYPIDPSRSLENRQFLAALAGALERLPGRQAAAVMLTDALGSSSDEACEALGVTRGNLWVLLHRARRQLQLELVAHRHG